MRPFVPRLSRAVGLCLGAVWCAAPLACATPSNVEEELSKMRREMAAMRKELSDTQLAMQRLESQVTLLSVGRGAVQKAPETEVARAPEAAAKNKTARGDGTGKQRPADRANRVLPVVRLGNKAEVPAESEEWEDPGAVDDGSPPIVIQLGSDPAHDERERITVDHDVLKRPDPVLGKNKAAKVAAAEATSSEIEAEYHAALAKFRGENQAAEALVLFLSFREKHPRSNLADNAAYWIGECHAALGAHDKAIQELEGLVKDYPKSSKRADALVRIGESWAQLSDGKRAAAAFSRVIENYPKTDAAGRARARLSQLSADGGK